MRILLPLLLAALAGVYPLQAQNPPQIVGVSPTSGSGWTQTLAFTYSDPAGASNLVSAQIAIGSSPSALNSCMIDVELAWNGIYLADNSGQLQPQPIFAGTNDILQNSQCIVYAAGSSIQPSDANTLIVSLAVSFKTAYAGNHNIWSAVWNPTLGADWTQFNSYTATAPPTPSLTVTLTPITSSVAAGSPAAYTVNTTATNLPAANVTYSISGLPSGTQPIFSPQVLPVPLATYSGVQTLIIGTAGNSPTGIYTPTVTASGGGLTATAPTSLTISPGPPALSSVTTDATLLTSAATTKVTVSLTAPAPTGGVLVNLASSNSAYLSVPTTPVTILAGNTSISTALATAGTVAAATPVTVTATGPSPFTPIRVNAGGVAYTDSFGRLWQADNGYQQGTMFSVSTPISGTPDPALYQTLRFSTTGLLQYQFNSIPSGTYQVTLKMAEIWFTSTNQRVFDVAINGTTVYPHLDIYAAAGANAPLDLAYPVTVTGGQIAITLTSIIGNPTVNAIEIVGWQAASQTAVTVVPPSISAVRVNAGGPAYTDSQGQFWSSNTSTSTYSTASPIAGTKDQTLYQSLLFSTSGPLSFNYPVPNGTYQLTLKFAELYYTSANQRVFDVLINGVTIYPHVDVFATAGTNTAFDLVFPITVTGGQFSLALNAVTGYPIVNAIEIVPWYGTWSNRKKLTIDRSRVSASAALLNFPVLVSLTDPGLRTTAKSDGSDILFTLADGVTRLNHEIESYSSATGQLTAWVNLPVLAPSTDTALYMYFGNPAASAQQSPPSTWDSDFTGVWHLKETPPATFLDSTAYQNITSTITLSASAQSPARIAGGLTFDGSAKYVDVTDQASLHPGAGSWTSSFWMRPQAIDQTGPLVTKRSNTGAYTNAGLYIGGPDCYQVPAGRKVLFEYIQDASNLRTAYTNNDFADGNWHYVTGVADAAAGVIRIYVDGVQQPITVDHLIGNWPNLTNTDHLLFANNNTSVNYLKGSLDEVRVSKRPRTSDWIATEFNNQNAPATFLTSGSWQGTAPPLPILSSVAVAPTTIATSATANVTVTLAGVAPTGGAVVSLTANPPVLTMPSSVTVLAGQTSAVATAAGASVPAATTVTLNATYNGIARTATVTVQPVPSISRLSPTTGTIGTPVTISGSNFGTTQGTSIVTFNGIAATPTSWNSATIIVPVPSGASTGDVVVTVAGRASNHVLFTVVVTSTLTITSAHSPNFTQADTGDTYTLTVRNVGTGPTSGAVVVTETIPPGMVPTSITGSTWTCTQPAGPCSRSDSLAPGASYPPITLTVSISPNGPASTTNLAAVSGGGSITASASDPTTIAVLPRYSNPLAFAVPASVVAGVPVTMSITYTNDNGPNAITGGHVGIGDCDFDWDYTHSIGTIQLHGGSHGIGDASGVLTTGPTIWAGACAIDLANSGLSTPSNNPKALVLSLQITFPQQDQRYAAAPMIDFTGRHEVYASGDSLAPDGSPLSTGDIDLGALIVSPGQDFLLNISPGNGNTMTIPPNQTATAMITAVSANGFSGPITLSQTNSYNNCFTVFGPDTLRVPNQDTSSGSVTGTITVWNNCPNNSTATLNYTATANPQGVNRLWHQSTTPMFAAGPSADFSVAVNAPLPATLAANGSITYSIYVQPINGQTGTVYLSLISTLPDDVVTPHFGQTQLTLDGSNTASTQLTLTSTAYTPGGSLPFTVRATLGTVTRTASFNVGTQVTTFQITSATGSPIVHNDGQEVQATLTVPATNAPTYTTCDSPDPEVTCAVALTSPGAVTVRITASTNAVHGLRVLKLNGIATSFDAFVADRQFQIYPPEFSVVAGGPVKEAYMDLPSPICKGDVACGSTIASAYADDSSISISSIPEGDQLRITASAPDSTTEGAYSYTVNACNNYVSDFFCIPATGVVYVTAAPPSCGNMPLALSPHSSGLRSLPRIDCPPEPSPKIFYNGQDVTNKTTIVVIGQQIVLTANVDTGTLDSTPWTVQGIKTGGWAVQFDPARPEETMGKPLDPDLTTASPTFYWVASGTNVVTLTVIDSSGAKYNASTTFNVVAPAYVIPPPSKTSVGIVRGHILRYGVLGSAESTGVTITGTITAPSGFSGSQQWVQIIPEDQKSVMAFWKKVGGAVTAVCRAFGLDTRYPATTLPSLKDSPIMDVDFNGSVDSTVAEGFDSYLMWKPDNPNAIFVPIAHVTWGWTGEAILNAQDTWILNPDSPPFTSDFYQEPTHEFPKWSTNVTSRPCTTQ